MKGLYGENELKSDNVKVRSLHSNQAGLVFYSNLHRGV